MAASAGSAGRGGCPAQCERVTGRRGGEQHPGNRQPPAQIRAGDQAAGPEVVVLRQPQDEREPDRQEQERKGGWHPQVVDDRRHGRCGRCDLGREAAGGRVGSGGVGGGGVGGGGVGGGRVGGGRVGGGGVG